MNAVAGPMHTGVGALPWRWYEDQFCRRWGCTPKQFQAQDMTVVLEHIQIMVAEQKTRNARL